MRPPGLANAVLQISVAAVYFVAAKAGLELASLVPQATLVWPPTGIALAAVVLLGLRVAPGIALGAFLANIRPAEPLLIAAGIAVGNTLEAVAAGWLLGQVGFRARLGRLRDAGALLLFGATVSTTISATIGVTSLCVGGVQPWSQFGPVWAVWWLGDAGGALVVAPLLLTWFSRPWQRWNGRQRTELLVLWLATCAIGAFAFGQGALARESALGYLAFPIVILCALRHGPPAAALAVVTTMGFALSGTLLGTGPFARASFTEGLVLLQLYTSVLALTGLVLGAVKVERDRSDRQRAAVHATASLLAAATPLAQLSNQVLRAICENLERDVGALWGVDREAGVMRCLGVWTRPGLEAEEFVAATRAAAFARGVGLPGRVWAAGQAAWIPDVALDANFPRAAVASRSGLHSGFGFPVRTGNGVEGVIEFFSRDVEEPDEALLEVVGTMGVQLGQFVERSRAEESLQQSQRDLAERVAELADNDRRKDEFLAMLAHELRNPLAPIAAAAEILGDVESAGPGVARAHEILDRQVQHMVKLIDDLLDVSRITRRKIQLERAEVDLATVVEYALEVSQGSIEARNHTLELVLPEESILLDVDLMRIAQALGNLLNNAAKFTAPGGRIRLDAELHGGELSIRVRDNGVGIEPRLLPRVFELFVQYETTADRTHGGLGIGLTLVRTLIEMHGGRVSAASEGKDRGSEFTVRLPARRGAPRHAPERAAAGPSPDRVRILLVEDNRDSADALAHLLRRRGHDLHVAHDGRDGLAQARTLRPDVIVLDIGLPELDGYEVARRLREERGAKRPLLVALSGYGQPEDRRRAREAGFDHHLVKPVRLDELERILVLASAG